MKKRILCLAAAVCLILGGCGSSSGTQGESQVTEHTANEDGTTTLKVGTNLALGTASPYVALNQGYFDDSSVQIELAEFSDGSTLMEAFAAGELDIAFVGIAPVATWQNKGIELKVVAAANGGGHVVMTREETGIETVADLKGKTIAEPNISTVTDALLRDKILPSGSLTQEDITAISGMKPADMASVLEVTKEVDAIITWEPYASQAEATYDDIRVVYDAASEIKAETGSDSFYPVNVVIASQELIDNNPEALNEFLGVYKKTVDFINTDESANQVLAEILSLDESVIENARKRIDYSYQIDEQGIMDTLQWSYDLSYITSMPDASQLIDTSWLDALE
ncbi:MAG: ABC transporter substrate-binding protein [Firmicutes bacterium]|nr:ABC transporter substrate-binding protein [Bacillota bacterium]